MRRILESFWILLILGATEAWGQSGLYGAPEVISFPPTDAAPLQGRVLPAAELPQPIGPSTPRGPSASFGPSGSYSPAASPSPSSAYNPSVPAPSGAYNPQGGYPSGASSSSGSYQASSSSSSGSTALGPGQARSSYRYAQAPTPYGVPTGVGETISTVEAPSVGGSPEAPSSAPTGRVLPYVESEAPTFLQSRPSWPVPEGGWSGQGTSLPGGSSPPNIPHRTDRSAPSGGNASPNLVDQMLRETDQQTTFGGVGTTDSPLAKALEGNGCPEPGCCWGFLVPDCPWYARVLVFMMGRDEPNRFWTSYETDNNPNQLMHTNDIGLAWRVGGEIRFGRRFGCSNSWAVEAAYWTLDPFDGRTAISHPNGVSTPINLEYVWFYRSTSDWSMAADLFDNAREHRLYRQDEFHNVEINFLRLQRLCDPHFPLDLHWGLGARWFRFQEELLFGSLRSGTWGASGGRNEAYINQELTNDLIGAQLTVEMTYFIHRNWRIFLTPRVGLYNNHIHLDFEVYRGDGTAARPQPSSGVSGTYPVRATTDTLSFLTQLDAGVEWHFAKNWTAAIGYRAVVATGMGLADNQFPAYLVDLPEVGHIDHNGHLILHGGFASLTVNF